MLAKTLFACASLVAATIAQTTSRIAFTVLPTNVTAGKPTTLQWGGGDGSAVTITLQQGMSTDLKTVLIVTGDATGFSYTWTPEKSLPDGDNYALKIEQGDNEPNYTGMITLTGGSAAVSSSASASATSSASSSVTTSPSSGGVVPIVGHGSGSSSANVTTTQIVKANATATQIVGTGGAVGTGAFGTGAVGTGAGASGSAATGTALHRNTTMSKATLTSSTSSSSSSAAATTTGSGSTTTSGPAPSSSSKSGAVMVAASNFALLCAAVVGVMYLG